MLLQCSNRRDRLWAHSQDKRRNASHSLVVLFSAFLFASTGRCFDASRSAKNLEVLGKTFFLRSQLSMLIEVGLSITRVHPRKLQGSDCKISRFSKVWPLTHLPGSPLRVPFVSRRTRPSPREYALRRNDNNIDGLRLKDSIRLLKTLNALDT